MSQVCRDFQRGTCRYGVRCKFQHIIPQQGGQRQGQQQKGGFDAGANRFAPLNNNAWGNAPPARQPAAAPASAPQREHKCLDTRLCREQIREDAKVERPTFWRPTAYAHYKYRPNDMVGDVSFEELRAEAYLQAKQGAPLSAMVARERALFAAKDAEFQALVNNPYRGPAPAPQQPPPPQTPSTPFPTSFPSPTPSLPTPTLFGKPLQSPAFTPQPAPASFGTGFPPPSQPSPAGFSPPPFGTGFNTPSPTPSPAPLTLFGKPVAPGAAPFGGGTQQPFGGVTTSPFGQGAASQGTQFGQPSSALPRTQFGQPSSALPGSQFGQPSSALPGSQFGQPSSALPGSQFGQPTAFGGGFGVGAGPASGFGAGAATPVASGFAAFGGGGTAFGSGAFGQVAQPGGGGFGSGGGAAPQAGLAAAPFASGMALGGAPQQQIVATEAPPVNSEAPTAAVDDIWLKPQWSLREIPEDEPPMYARF